MATKSSSLKIDTVFALMIFCVFAISVFLVLILSGSTYRNMVDTAAYGQNERIALSYIRTKVRQADVSGAVSVTDFRGANALTITQHDFGLVTRIFYYDGWLRELFAEVGFDDHFYPVDGTPLLRVDSFYFAELDGGLLYVGTDHGSITLFLRTAQGSIASESF